MPFWSKCRRFAFFFLCHTKDQKDDNKSLTRLAKNTKITSPHHFLKLQRQAASIASKASHVRASIIISVRMRTRVSRREGGTVGRPRSARAEFKKDILDSVQHDSKTRTPGSERLSWPAAD